MNKITKSILSSLSDEIENGLNVNFECRSGKISVVWHWEEDGKVTSLTDSDIEVCEKYNFQYKSCDTDYKPLIDGINSSLVNPPANDDTLDDVDVNDHLFLSWKGLTDEEKKEALDREMNEYWEQNTSDSVNKKLKYIIHKGYQSGKVRDSINVLKTLFNMLNNNKNASHLLNNNLFKDTARIKIEETIHAGKMTKNLYEEVCQLYSKLDVPKKDVVLGRPYWNLFTTEQQKILTGE